MKQFLLIISTILLCGACQGIKKGRKLKPYLSIGTDTIRLNASTNQNTSQILEMHYTGAGSVYIRYKQQAVWIDPFFSNPGPVLSTFFNKTRPDSAIIQQFFKNATGFAQDKKGIIKAVLISHAHYDHLMDAPTLWHQQMVNQQTVCFYGSKTAGYYLRGAGIDSTKIITVQHKSATNHQIKGRDYELGKPKIKIYPVKNAHAPHFKLLGWKIKFFKGQAYKTMWPKRLRHFKEGQTFSYLIDFLNNEGKIDFRVFVQTSSSKAPNGLIPQSMLDKRPIDVAVLGVASYKYVKPYPKGLLERLKPRHAVLVHWENFFCGLERLKEKPRVVPSNNILRFIKKVEGLMSANTDANTTRKAWTLPQVDTKLVFIIK